MGARESVGDQVAELVPFMARLDVHLFFSHSLRSSDASFSHSLRASADLIGLQFLFL